MKMITLVGDSILDNFYWLENKQHDLKYELEQHIFCVKNYAVDESRLDNVLYGIEPKDIYQESREYPYPVDENGIVQPLELLSNEDMIVLSVGGNDLRVTLFKMTIFLTIFLILLLHLLTFIISIN